MAGPLTNVGIGVTLGVLVIAMGVLLLNTLATGYNVPIDNDLSSFNQYTNQTATTTATYDNSSRGASINTQSVGSAQLQGLISTEQTKMGFWNTLKVAMNDFLGFFPIDGRIIAALMSIITLVSGAMIYRAIRGVDP